jgi:pimeloyl-ACP methyl ester carboxylesterase
VTGRQSHALNEFCRIGDEKGRAVNIRFDTHLVGQVAINVAVAGDPSRPLLICLHGFPEYWAAWREVMEELESEFFLIAPDQRGFNLSSKPHGVPNYRTGCMVGDLASLGDRYSPDRPFILAGHDWGASVAYAYAMSHPDRVSHLVIANGVHPVCFQKAIFEDEEQRKASQYINRLRAGDAEELLAEDGFRRLTRMVEGFSAAPFFDDEMKAAYLVAWSRRGALTAMLNWYRASPIAVPETGASAAGASLLDVPAEKFRVAMPHLVLWGEEDQALRPSCLEGLDRFASDFAIETIPGASHWILHEKPHEVAAAIRRFVA